MTRNLFGSSSILCASDLTQRSLIKLLYRLFKIADKYALRHIKAHIRSKYTVTDRVHGDMEFLS